MHTAVTARLARLAVGSLLLAACVGQVPALSPEPAGSAGSSTVSTISDAERLRARAEDAALLLTARDWTGYAAMASPRLRDRCAPERLAALFAVERLAMRALLEVGDDVPIEVRVKDVTTSEDEGSVTLVLVADGEELSDTASSDEWSSDGTDWWLDDDSWREACA